ncbi:DUF3592 domain-containing protein [Thalassotalea litorea]|uniref:DUF3592 domain-containing protein n=1 Tax=Thalassotalea litorea TaxID=2020715 RepID=A0A5R9IBV9_9GAMM|nr:DUF3592 domain-containing protein [Thalassotalea litorea]TLU61095.1 DUF3592 domain-containing protein [Thalassotalea litorea]
MENLNNDALIVYGLLALGIVIEVFLMYKNHMAKNWSQTQGELISSEVGMEQSGNSFGLAAKVNYKYTANGKEFQSNQIAYATLGSGFALFKNFYVKNNNLTVFFNPLKPEVAVILPGIRLFHALDIAFILGIAYYLYGVFGL